MGAGDNCGFWKCSIGVGGKRLYISLGVRFEGHCCCGVGAGGNCGLFSFTLVARAKKLYMLLCVGVVGY